MAGGFLFFQHTTKMLNIDTRLLEDVSSDQYWLLCHILKRIDADGICYPSNKKLCEDTKWEIKKLQRIKAELIDKGLLVVTERRKADNAQSSNFYKVQTDLVGVYVPAKKLTVALERDTPPELFTDNGPAPKKANKVLTFQELVSEDITHKIIDWLNAIKDKYGMRGKVHHTSARAVSIRNRIHENKVTIEQVKRMIEFKASTWKGKTFGDGRSCEQYLTIETMFATKHFMKYIEESEAAPVKDWTETRTTDSETLNVPLGNISW